LTGNEAYGKREWGKIDPEWGQKVGRICEPRKANLRKNEGEGTWGGRTRKIKKEVSEIIAFSYLQGIL